MLKEYTLLLIALCLALAGAARAEDWSAWQRTYDPATRTRFIPVELWTGAPWDGTHEIRMAPAALEFGRRGDKSIKGQTAWNGIQVYERLNRDKLQLFVIRDDRTGLGRVFDSRYPQLDCRGEVKFPLGHWKQGEVREYQLDCARGKRPLKVTIEDRVRLRRRAALAALPLAPHGRARPRHRYALRVPPAARAGRRAGERVVMQLLAAVSAIAKGASRFRGNSSLRSQAPRDMKCRLTTACSRRARSSARLMPDVRWTEMTERFFDRLVPDTYRKDERWGVALVRAGRAVDWASAQPDEQASIPEGIAERLLVLGRAYDLHQLSTLGRLSPARARRPLLGCAIRCSVSKDTELLLEAP